jgi:hypothetical protein
MGSSYRLGVLPAHGRISEYRAPSFMSESQQNLERQRMFGRRGIEGAVCFRRRIGRIAAISAQPKSIPRTQPTVVRGVRVVEVNAGAPLAAQLYAEGYTSPERNLDIDLEAFGKRKGVGPKTVEKLRA